MAITVTSALLRYGGWRQGQGNYSANTWAGERPGLYQFSRVLGNPFVEDITQDDVGRWWDWLDVADSTKATRLAQLRSFFDWCVRMGFRLTDPTRMIRAPRVQPVIRDRLTADELLSLLDVARTPRDRALLALGMNLGLRGGEIAGLSVGDVNWRDETIRVAIEKTNDIDDMPMTYELFSELAVWMAHYAANLGYMPTSNAFLIPSQHIAPSGTVTYRPTQTCSEPFEVVKYALDQIGWDTKQEGVHTLRRSVARLYFDKVEASESFDSALLATMTLLHHTRPETTLTYVGRDRATLARDRFLKGHRFLSELRTPVRLRSADEVVEERAAGIFHRSANRGVTA
jgi:integrase